MIEKKRQRSWYTVINDSKVSNQTLPKISGRKPQSNRLKNRYASKLVRGANKLQTTTPHTLFNDRVSAGAAYLDNENINTLKSENLEWYVRLASQCYNEGFQWHINYLNDFSELNGHRKLRQIKTEHRSHFDANQTVDSFIENDDNCHIRVNITGSSSKRLSFKKYITNNDQPIKFYKHNIMNSNDIGRDHFDTINNNNNNSSTQQTIEQEQRVKFNDILDQFSLLKINTNTNYGRRSLPQIILTDFSASGSSGTFSRNSSYLLCPTTDDTLSNIIVDQSIDLRSLNLSIPITSNERLNEPRPP